MATVPEQIAYEQTRQELANAVNRSRLILKLPAYQIAAVLKELYNEVSAEAQADYQKALIQYQQTQTKPTKEQD